MSVGTHSENKKSHTRSGRDAVGCHRKAFPDQESKGVTGPLVCSDHKQVKVELRGMDAEVADSPIMEE